MSSVQCGIRKGANQRLSEYCENKRKEGKPYEVAVNGCANKLIHHVYAILRKNEPCRQNKFLILPAKGRLCGTMISYPHFLNFPRHKA